ncbi:hypothetical protein K1T71_008252 [Dendrolimus kikuchii]|uniref:Uncharacterized protein n=1 Tax=Dendrolimus kikuchii TaxID=765133 RepID=A0ACC1CWP6_9NEOP|nr:hypothetical protein K1T71_008252 [Dendrolimus kikuchii]
MDFINKVVVITGASSGIGAAAAVLYSKQSAKLVLVGRNEEALNDVAKQCEEAKGIKPLVVKADLTVDEDVQNIVKSTIEAFGGIDVLVNNAGVGFHGSIRDGIELLDRAFASNLRSAYLLTSLATPYLIQSKGNVVNVSSVAGIKPIPQLKLLPYSVTKAGIDQFTRCVALELAPYGVRVNSVNPGCTKTPFLGAAGFSEETAIKAFENLCKNNPLRKVVEPEEIADYMLYLSSDRARSITGSIRVIDNGEMLI